MRLYSKEEMDKVDADFQRPTDFMGKHLGEIVKIIEVGKCRSAKYCKYFNECKGAMTTIYVDGVKSSCCGIRLSKLYNWKKL